MATVLEAHHTRARDPTLSSAAVAVALAERARSERGRGCGVLAYWSTLRTQRRQKVDGGREGLNRRPRAALTPARVWGAPQRVRRPRSAIRGHARRRRRRNSTVVAAYTARPRVRAAVHCVSVRAGRGVTSSATRDRVERRDSGLSGRGDGHGRRTRGAAAVAAGADNVLLEFELAA